MATPYEWRIDAIEQKAQRACVDGLRSALDSSLTRIEQLERTVEELSSANMDTPKDMPPLPAKPVEAAEVRGPELRCGVLLASSETPRTDAEEKTLTEALGGTLVGSVPADFAREMERELKNVRDSLADEIHERRRLYSALATLRNYRGLHNTTSIEAFVDRILANSQLSGGADNPPTKIL